MPDLSPVCVRHGPLTVYLQAFDGCPDLQRVLSTHPPKDPVVWLDSARRHPVTGRWSLLGWDPWLTFRACGERIELRTSGSTTVVRDHPLRALRQILTRYRSPRRPGPHGRAVGLLGFASYELNRWIEALAPAQPTERAMPDLLWFGMRMAVLVDHLEERSWLVSVVDPHRPSVLARRQAREALEQAALQLAESSQPMAGTFPVPSGATTVALAAATTQAEFEGMVARTLEYIQAGEIFQANISQRFSAPWRGSVWSLYETLRSINPSPFACGLSCGDLAVVSSSPERLVRVQEGRVETRPIAGTRPRGLTPPDDVVNSLDLLLSEKERSEHLMLVDLERNDLGRLARVGSVQVDEFMTLEEYSHVIHIVSNVSGLLRPGLDAVDVIRAVFPGGTITGCPKVRCMQILRELEPVARGLYSGSIGYLAFDGSMDLNIAIRTMVIRGGQLSFHVGAGIVADSIPEREYQETLDKAQALVEALRIVGEPVRTVDARVG